MSELVPGLPPPPPPSTPRDAAAVILWRPGLRGTELFWVMRGPSVGFASGFRAFPGGRLDADDFRVPVAGHAGEGAALRACAVRETFEETGVLIARGPALSRAARDEARRALLDGSLLFADFLAASGLEVDAEQLHYTARWVSPEFIPRRYDARVFCARIPEGEQAEVWPGELVHGEPIAAEDALAQWARGEAPLHPPNLHAIRALARVPPEEALPILRAPPRMGEDHVTDWIEFQQGLWSAPLRTPTLPPASHTSAFLLAVDGGVAVVDPGSPWPEEQAKLEGLLAAHAADGRQPLAVWLTHEHQDHVGGAAALAARHLIPVLAHPACIARLPGDARAHARPITDGELLGGRWRAIHTPGHARGHLVFHDERTGALLCGDLLSSLSTIVVDPPEGDMGDYLASLARARALAPLRTIYPSHGGPLPDGAAALDAALAHRHARTAKVLDALAAGPGTLAEVTARAYEDTLPALHGLAARSCLAALELLAREGRARLHGGRWMSSSG